MKSSEMQGDKNAVSYTQSQYHMQTIFGQLEEGMF
jgi:hypothetical protein